MINPSVSDFRPDVFSGLFVSNWSTSWTIARNLEPACALMASDFSVICMGKTIILEFKIIGKANITALALDLFLTV